MIKFFRHIRQSLLAQNKFRRYLLYAIGEIILVVIGILIALQINNWNQTQKQKSIEAQYLTNIIGDLEEQFKSIEVQMEYEREYYETASKIIDYYNTHQTFSLDSIFFKGAALLTQRKTFVVTDPTYTDLISSGNITLIRNKTNKDMLLNYYQELERIEKVIQSNNSLLIDNHYISILSKNGYYYRNLKKTFKYNFSEIPGYVVEPKYDFATEEISKNILSKDENKLAFINVISLRQEIALAHYAFLQQIRSITQSLMDELEVSNHD